MPLSSELRHESVIAGEFSYNREMTDLSVVVTYYNNPLALRRLLGNISQETGVSKKNLELVVVDDGSEKVGECEAICNEQPMVATRVFRVLVDIPWNHRAARNIGVHEADSPWVLAIDIDTLPALSQTLMMLPSLNIEDKSFYLFNRVEEGSRKPLAVHHDTILISKRNYWFVGGFDENFAGVWGFGKLWFADAKKKLRPIVLWNVFVTRTTNVNPLDSQTKLKRDRPWAVRTKVLLTRLSQRLIGKPERKILSVPYISVN